MERVRRRLYTSVVTLVASVIVLAAVISGLFRGAVMLAPEYREELAQRVSDLAGRPVSIARMDLTWRGLRPSLDLHGVVVFDPDSGVASLRAETLRLGIGLDKLVRGEWQPDHVELAGFTLNLFRDEDGALNVRGLGLDPAAQRATSGTTPEALAAELSRFSEIRFQRCTVVIEQGVLARNTVALELDELVAKRRFDGFMVRAEGQLPAAFGGRARITADIKGDPALPVSWQGRWEVTGDKLQPQAWLQPWLLPTAQVLANELDLSLRGQLSAGALERIALDLRAARLAAEQGGVLQRDLRDLVLVGYLDFDHPGWRVDLRRFSVGGEQPWRIGRASAAWQPLAGGTGFALHADAERLRPALLQPWLALLAEPPAALAKLPTFSGDLQAPVLRVRREADQILRLAYRAELQDFGLANDTVQMRGLNGELSGSEREGRLTLPPQALYVNLPRAFEQPLHVEQLAAELHWRQTDGSWQIRAPTFAAQLLGAQTQGQLSLELSPEQRPSIDLDATLSAEDVRPLKAYMPSIWKPPLRNWLDRAVQSGRVPSGRIRMAGTLGAFPMDQPAGKGVFELDLDLLGASLAFQEDWPRVDAVDARLQFRGRSLKVLVDRGTTLGARIEKAEAKIEDLRNSVLELDTSTRGDLRDYYAYLQGSPLRTTLAPLLRYTRGQGRADLDLHLDIPFKNPRETRASGRVRLNQAQLLYTALDEPFRKLQGEIRFNGDQVRGEGLTAEFYGEPLQVSLSPGQSGGIGLNASFKLPYGQGSALEAAFVPSWLRSQFVGTGHWQGHIILGKDEPLVLTSKLVGVRSSLPPPLGKTAEASRTLTVRVGAAESGADVALGVDYADLLRGQFELSKGRLLRGRLQFGPQPLEALPTEGVIVGGSLANAEIDEWVPQIQALGREAGGGEGPGLQAADLMFQRIGLGALSARDVSMSVRPNGPNWAITLDGKGAHGHLLWPSDSGGEVFARLEDLNLAYAVSNEDEGESDAVLNPMELPTVDLQVNRLQLNQAALGQLRLLSARIPDGQRLAELNLGGGELTLSASGQWWRQDQRSGAELAFDAQSGAVSRVLAAFGYVQTLEARRTRINGDLRWSPSEEGVAWSQARGKVHVKVDNGILRAVEPGAGRVLGLMNFYALPRRLTLNFRDVVGQGLSFDSIGGEFQLGDGDAVTRNLVVDAPSLRIETRGRIGLAAKDYDQQVTVYPDVSAGVTLASALLGGPALGALMLIAQEILDKPLDQATQLSYHLGGTWDNPRVTRVDGGG